MSSKDRKKKWNQGCVKVHTLAVLLCHFIYANTTTPTAPIRLLVHVFVVLCALSNNRI